jgi:lipoprotein-anchoring transpeptidase ErfK/SrfK
MGDQDEPARGGQSQDPGVAGDAEAAGRDAARGEAAGRDAAGRDTAGRDAAVGEAVGRDGTSREAVGPPPRRRRRLTLALLALIPAIPIAIGVIIGLGQPGAAPASKSSATFTPAPAHTTASAPQTAPAHATPPAKPEGAAALPVPPGPGAIIAVLTRPTALRARPGGPTIARLGTKTHFGSPETVLVVRHKPGWLGVVATEAGNGHIGWIVQRAAALARITWELKVSLSTRRLTVLDAGKVVQRYTVAIGRPAAPTPTGRFAVTDRLTTGDPAGPYGCCILALSARSPHAIQDWNGGDRIAIHSTPDVTSIGQPVSHGCLRLTIAEGRWLLDHVPLGTPAVISS